MATPKSVAFHTLGCKLNYSETSAIQRLFEKDGYAVRDFAEGADVYVINTCSVTDFADRKCRSVVRKALRAQPEAKVVVVGCYAQLKPDEIARIPGVDLVLGAAEKFRILDYIHDIGDAPGTDTAWALANRKNEHFHEAIATQPSDKVDPNSVLAVVQKGYVLNERLLRPALVVVAKD